MPDPIILTDALLAIGTGTASADRNLSNRVRSVTWTREFDDHDVTTMGSSQRIHAIGLGDSTLEAELLQSYSTGDGGENIDNLINTLIDLSATGKSFLVRLRPKNANRAASNPEYSMLAKLAVQDIIDGEVGQPLMEPLRLLAAGDITRATATT